MSRIKCPNCGSTAQVELIWKDWDDYSAMQINEYVCRCGCDFEVVFEPTMYKILSKEGK